MCAGRSFGSDGYNTSDVSWCEASANSISLNFFNRCHAFRGPTASTSSVPYDKQCNMAMARFLRCSLGRRMPRWNNNRAIMATLLFHRVALSCIVSMASDGTNSGSVWHCCARQLAISTATLVTATPTILRSPTVHGSHCIARIIRVPSVTLISRACDTCDAIACACCRHRAAISMPESNCAEIRAARASMEATIGADVSTVERCTVCERRATHNCIEPKLLRINDVRYEPA